MAGGFKTPIPTAFPHSVGAGPAPASVPSFRTPLPFGGLGNAGSVPPEPEEANRNIFPFIANVGKMKQI